jgi:hypothetical protein
MLAGRFLSQHIESIFGSSKMSTTLRAGFLRSGSFETAISAKYRRGRMRQRKGGF